MDYYSKEGHAKAIYLIFFNFLTIIYTFIGTFLYAFKYPFNGMPNKLDEFQHEIAPAILGISILISFAIVLLYIIISFVAFIKNKKAFYFFADKQNENLQIERFKNQIAENFKDEFLKKIEIKTTSGNWIFYPFPNSFSHSSAASDRVW